MYVIGKEISGKDRYLMGPIEQHPTKTNINVALVPEINSGTLNFMDKGLAEVYLEKISPFLSDGLRVIEI